MRQSTGGFTVVELLIVIVVIAILAAISAVSYSGIQQRSRDSIRDNNVAEIAKALELYYVDNGKYPEGRGSVKINTWWTTSADSSWGNLESSLSRYIGSGGIPKDPKNDDSSAMSGGFSYDYYSFNSVANTCNAGGEQGYILLYRYESQARKDTFIGNCGSSPQYFGGVNNYRVVKK